MTKIETIIAEIQRIPEEKLDVLYDFVHELVTEENTRVQPHIIKPGILKGNFTISEDFDEPLEDFNEYQ
jgi:hypothetical protein